MNSGLEVLKERGFIKQCTDLSSLEKILSNESVSFYVGIDPTASSMHAGHLVPLFAMAHLQRAGHKPIAVIGGGTARVGDPSGRTDMRKMLTIDQIKENALKIKKQVSRFVDFNNDKALLLDNADWLADLNYLEFLRDIGKHFSVNRMLSFETYKIRIETGLSFIEFNYQLLQSYDFLVLNQKYGCKLQIGGDDQWGNIVAGVDLTRRVEGNEVFGLTFPLVTRADGKKMGKTEKGAIFLDPVMLSPYEFYQYWRNVPDADVEKFLMFYTFIPAEEIKKLCSRKDQEINKAKELLAYEITSIVHGRDEADKAKRASFAAFSTGGSSDKSAIPSIGIEKTQIEKGINVLDLFSRTSLCSSKGEARRLIVQGGASVNEIKITDIDTLIDTEWLKDKEILLKAGKKRFFRVLVK